MMDQSKIVIILVALLFCLPCVSSQCLKNNQTNGFCTGCDSTRVLISGYCFTRLAGCLTQLSQLECGNCSNPYLLINSTCVPIATVNPANLNSSSSTILQSQPSTLSTNSYINLYSTNEPSFSYGLINDYFKKKYPKELSNKTIDMAQLASLKSTYGQIFTLIYNDINITNSSVSIVAQGIVDYSNNVTELIFGNVSANNNSIYQVKSSLWRLDRRIVFLHLQTLNNAILNKIEQLSPNVYRFYYINFVGGIFVIDVQKSTSPQDANLIAFLDLESIMYMIDENTALNYVFSQYPRLQSQTSYAVNYYSTFDSLGVQSDFYRFTFDNLIVIEVRINGINILLNNYQQPDSIDFLASYRQIGQTTSIASTTNTSLTIADAVGSYKPFLNLNDKYYLAAFQYLTTQYTSLKTKHLESVRYQIVAGTNFLILLTNTPFSSNQYMAVVFMSLQGTFTIKNLTKNGINVLGNLPDPFSNLQIFNYEADPMFLQLYQYFVATMKISLIPISSVKKLSYANFTYTDYLITYTPDQYSVVRYNSLFAQPFTIITYNIDGIQIYNPNKLNTTVSSFATLSKNRTRLEIVNFLISQKAELFSDAIVIQATTSTNTYLYDVLTDYGTYFTRIQDNGILSLPTVTKVSDDYCSDLDVNQLTLNNDIANINSYLIRSSTAIASAKLSLVQAYLLFNNTTSSNSTLSYRFLYSNLDNRYEIKVIDSNGKFYIQSNTVLKGNTCQHVEVLVNNTCIKDCSKFTF